MCKSVRYMYCEELFVVKHKNKPIALWQALDKIDQNVSCHMEESREGWCSPAIVKRSVTNILTIFTSVVVVCISAVLAFVLIWHYCLQVLVSTIILASAHRVAEARPTQKVICSNPELTTFDSIVTFIGVLVWIMIHCRGLTWLQGFQHNRICTL